MEVAKALLNKGIEQGRRGESDAELAAYNDLIVRFGAADIPELQVEVAKALLNKGVAQGRTGESDAELAAYNDLVARFGASDLPELCGQVARALFNKATTHGQRGEADEELVAYDDLIARFGTSDIPDLQVLVSEALLNKVDRQIMIGRPERALRTVDELDRRFGATNDNESSTVGLWRWRAKLLRTHALIVQEEHQAALDVFQSVCAKLNVDDDAMLGELLKRVPMLIAAGASESSLARVLLASSNTAIALAPLVVALRLGAGESVRASEEVLEVAADLRKGIEAAIRSGPSQAVQEGVG